MEEYEFLRIGLLMRFLPLSVFLITNQPADCIVARPGKFDIFCSSDEVKVTFSCGIGSVIEIMRAEYAFNMDIIRKCVDDNDFTKSEPCGSDVGATLGAICNGNRTCQIFGSDFLRLFSSQRSLMDKKQCSGAYLKHLQAEYACRKLSSIKDVCKLKNYRLNRDILLSSEQFRLSKRKGPSCRLSLKVKEGRRIRMELIDSPKRKLSGQYSRNNCKGSYGALKVEQKDLRSKMICGGQGEVQMFETDTSSTEISVVERILTNTSMNFLLNISVIGCPNLYSSAQNPGTTYVRKSNHLTIRCKDGRRWRLECSGNEWTGGRLNCTEPAETGSSSLIRLGSISIPPGILIAIILGLALIISVCILTIGLLMLQRQRRKAAYAAIYSMSEMAPVEYRRSKTPSGVYQRTLPKGALNGGLSNGQLLQPENEYASVQEISDMRGAPYGCVECARAKNGGGSLRPLST